MGWGLIGSSVILLFLSVHCKRVKIPYNKHILLQGQKPNSLHSSPELSSLDSLPDPLRAPILMAFIHFLKGTLTQNLCKLLFPLTGKFPPPPSLLSQILPEPSAQLRHYFPRRPLLTFQTIIPPDKDPPLTSISPGQFCCNLSLYTNFILLL